MIGERKEERGGLNEDGGERILKDFIINDDNGYSRKCGLIAYLQNQESEIIVKGLISC